MFTEWAASTTTRVPNSSAMHIVRYLARAGVLPVKTANVMQQDQTDLLHISVGEDDSPLPYADPEIMYVEEQRPDNACTYRAAIDHDYCEVKSLTPYVSNVLMYIAAWLVRRLTEKQWGFSSPIEQCRYDLAAC